MRGADKRPCASTVVSGVISPFWAKSFNRGSKIGLVFSLPLKQWYSMFPIPFFAVNRSGFVVSSDTHKSLDMN
jgi:hypothetical protein